MQNKIVMVIQLCHGINYLKKVFGMEIVQEKIHVFKIIILVSLKNLMDGLWMIGLVVILVLM